MKIGVDLISGESAMGTLVLGFLDALAEDKEMEGVLIGPSSVYDPLLKKFHKKIARAPGMESRISILEASEVITMEDDPLTAMKQKKDSSIVKGLQAVKAGELDAFFSPGNTGAIVVASSIILGRAKGVKKTPLAMFMPKVSGGASILLDVGGMVEIEPEDYLKFGVMGSVYAREILGIENPRIGLFNIGEEEHKGTPAVKEANKAFRESGLNFVGNVEGNHLFFDKADVIVCDGYIGNIALKTIEGTSKAIMKMMKGFLKSDFLATLGTPLVAGALMKLKATMDPEIYGGAPLLGVKGNVFIGHGASGRRAIFHGMHAAAKCIRRDVLTKVRNQMEERNFTEEAKD
jgi:glycerol-3-phosphate acyltransferase PlsX